MVWCSLDFRGVEFQSAYNISGGNQPTWPYSTFGPHGVGVVPPVTRETRGGSQRFPKKCYDGSVNTTFSRKVPLMFPAILFLAASALAIDYGWEPLGEGGMKYIVQIDPDALRRAAQEGLPLESDIPNEAGEIRAISIRMGSGPLPRTNPPKADERYAPAGRQSMKPNNTGPSNSNAEPNANLPSPILQTAQGEPLPIPAEKKKEPSQESKAAIESKTAPPASTAGEPAKPYLPLIFVSLALFTSLGGNFYLVWIFAELRKRHRALLAG
jgi:hypothetical protein